MFLLAEEEKCCSSRPSVSVGLEPISLTPLLACLSWNPEAHLSLLVELFTFLWCIVYLLVRDGI